MMISRRPNQELENFKKDHEELYDRFYQIALKVQGWGKATEDELAFAESVIEKMLEAGVPETRIQVLQPIGKNPAEFKNYF